MKSTTPRTNDAVSSVHAEIGFGTGNVALAKLSNLSRELELELGSAEQKLEQLRKTAKLLSDALRVSVGLLKSEEWQQMSDEDRRAYVLKQYAQLEYLIGLNENYHIVPCSGNCRTQENVIVSKGSNLGMALCGECFCK